MGNLLKTTATLSPVLVYAVSVTAFSSPAVAFEPKIEVAISNPSKPTISGSTNLPNDTPLMVTIQVPREDAENPGHIIYPVMGGDSAVVHDGHYTAGPFSNGGSPYDRGTYIVSVVISTLALPDSVKPILGDTGEKLGGPNVKQREFGPDYEIKKRFEVR